MAEADEDALWTPEDGATVKTTDEDAATATGA
jgi:hypothetical protein